MITPSPQSAAPQMVERARAESFGQALAILLARQGYYDPRTTDYALERFAERAGVVDGRRLGASTLRAYLCGDKLPSDSKVRLLADALQVPRGVLLYVAGYLTADDLPNYPGPYATLETIEADVAEVAALPLSPEAKQRILRDLDHSARILRLVAAERAQTGYATAPDEREQLIELLFDLWAQTPPPPPQRTARTAEAEAPARQAATRHPAPATEPASARTLQPILARVHGAGPSDAERA